MRRFEIHTALSFTITEKDYTECFTAENIKGYTLNEYAFAGNVTDSDVTINFVYTKTSGGTSGGNSAKNLLISGL